MQVFVLQAMFFALKRVSLELVKALLGYGVNIGHEQFREATTSSNGFLHSKFRSCVGPCFMCNTHTHC